MATSARVVDLCRRHPNWLGSNDPVQKGAIDQLLIQELLPQKGTVKLTAGQSAQIGDEGT